MDFADAAEAASYLRHLERFSPQKMAAGEQAYGLTAVREMLHRQGDPQEGLPFVHVTGTNGKGSFVDFLEGMLIRSGIHVGCFTSPWVEYTDAIRLDGQCIPGEDFARILSSLAGIRAQMGAEGRQQPSEFELLVGVAMQWFSERRCDLVLLEVGMGGLRDATNVIGAPLLAVFMPISLDHTQVLGDTLEAIAREKAGIIKRGCAVLSAPQSAEALAVLRSRSAELGCPFFLVEGPTALPVGMPAPYQRLNAAVALRAAELLSERGFAIPQEAREASLRETVNPGRFELLCVDPALVLDGSHNPDGMRTLAEGLAARFPGERITLVIGLLADKNYGEMLEMILPLAGKVLTVQVPGNPRALPAGVLAAAVRERTKVPVESLGAADPEEIVRVLQQRLRAGELRGPVCICGSLYLALPLRRAWLWQEERGCQVQEKREH